MTYATINGKRREMSIYEKAMLLNVSRIEGEKGFVVTSGSDPRKAYRVSEDARTCTCQSYTLCCHKIAAKNRLDEEEAERREAYVHEFGIYDVA